MYASLNFSLLEEKDCAFHIHDRAFRYGDGLFETIMVKDGVIQFLGDHLARLKAGMQALAFEGKDGIHRDIIEHQIYNLLQRNHLMQGMARVRLQIWRKPGGFYTPENLHFHILITTKPHYPEKLKRHLHAGFSKKIRLYNSMFSRYKTLNALPYVLAGVEKSMSGFDDLVLLSQEGYISECTASNVFWVKEGKIKTPLLTTGCVAGVFRKNLIKQFEKAGMNVKKVAEKKEKLLEADHIFTCNVTGVFHIVTLEGKNFREFDMVNKLLTRQA
jgi:branched-chain amino acid aminotransferase/4-amino-4-deoxychorismate lyase